MLPIEEFQAAIAGYGKRLGVGVLGSVASLVVGFAMVCVFHAPLRVASTNLAGKTFEDALMCVSFILVGVVFFTGIWLADRRARNDARLFCPSCGKSILEMSCVVIATRNCGSCGKRVLAEPESFD